MSGVWRSVLASLAAVAAAALLAGMIWGAAWGWAAGAAGLVALLAHHVRQLSRLARWLADPAAGPVPEATGSWDEVLTALHRFERAAARREKELAEAFERFRRAAQALPDGVVILGDEHRIEWANDKAAAMLGLHPLKDAGQPIGNLVRDPAFAECLLAQGAHEVYIEAARGGRLMLRLIPYGRSQKLLLCRDVTQAERVETMRRDFVANVSHELRTPLTVLVGFLETVRELKLDPQRQRDYLAMMREQASRMQRIIDDLLALSVLESSPPPAAERVRVRALLERVFTDAKALSGEGHALSLDADPHVDLAGSEQELASAFGNLVSNAIRYTPRGGNVRLAWSDGPEGATFAVEDTGVGIAPEHIPRLTERFYRVDRGRSRETGGTGLGLAIVKHALARHEATLSIESTPGAGSRFSVRFPPQRTLPALVAERREG
ncbi:MAG TPA: phosphate regulon sensor histidine kinase PhoR [Burkholderiales bacterium]